MAPELVNAEPAGVAADIFAVGAILYELLSGKPPYHADTAAQIFDRVLAGAVTPLESEVAGLPPKIVTLVHRALSRHVSERPAT